MNLKNRLKTIERRVGPTGREESSAAVKRQGLRLERLLYAQRMLHLAAWMKANPDGDIMTDKIDLTGIEVPEPEWVDMSPRAFARDHEIMVATIHKHYLQRAHHPAEFSTLTNTLRSPPCGSASRKPRWEWHSARAS